MKNTRKPEYFYFENNLAQSISGVWGGFTLTIFKYSVKLF